MSVYSIGFVRLFQIKRDPIYQQEKENRSLSFLIGAGDRHAYAMEPEPVCTGCRGNTPVRHRCFSRIHNRIGCILVNGRIVGNIPIQIVCHKPRIVLVSYGTICNAACIFCLVIGYVIMLRMPPVSSGGNKSCRHSRCTETFDF